MTARHLSPAVGTLLGLAAYGAVWLTLAWTLQQDPTQVGTRDVYPVLSGAALFAAAGYALGSVWRAGLTRIAGGALVGAVVGFGGAVAHLLHPSALPLSLTALALLATGAGAGVLVGIPLEALRARRTRPVARPANVDVRDGG